MSRKTIPRETEKPKKLTRAQKKEIDAVLRKYKGDGKPRTAQATIPYEAIYPDGVCRIDRRTFSKCIAFEDISYQLAQPETRTAIFEHLCDLYNYVDASIHVQLSFLNRKVDPVQYAKSFEITPRGDDFDDIRAEYTAILQKQLASGNNGIIKTKYLTFTIEADSLKTARARLTRIGLDLLGYFSKDKDMLGAEKAYAKLEQKLQRYLDTYEATHNYDEYHFYLDEIEHDPYVLISILSALHDGVFTLAEVQGELEMLFEKQYILTETVTMQIRYRTKMMVIIGPYGVPQVITYQEPYEYYICTVKLKNKDLSHLPVEVLTEEQLSAYSLYMRTLGNRPDLFGKAQYPNASTIKQPTYYDIPPEALKDDRFAAMMEEATKYIGYPYVWGGSSPSTSFDCSGYISWVLNHSGWNVGRQTAQGLYNFCTPVSAAQVKPGDLVFFKGTYDTSGVSHCGIYVGNSIMLHCGDPSNEKNRHQSGDGCRCVYVQRQHDFAGRYWHYNLCRCCPPDQWTN